MTTKLELAQRALKMLYPELRGDEKTSLKEMVYAIGNARDKVIANDFWIRYSNEDSLVWDGSLRQYDITVFKNNSRGIWYLDLPAKPLDLPNGLGIYLITDCNNTEDAYIPIKKPHNWLYSGSFAKDMEGSNCYYQEGLSVYFSNDFLDGDKVNVTLVPSGIDIDEDDEDFGVSPDKELDVINLAIELYSVQKNIPQDITNNRLSDQ